MKQLISLLLLLTMLSACSIPPKSNQPATRTFRLAPAISAVNTTQQPLNIHLYIPQISVTPGLDNSHIVLLKSPYEQDFIAHSQWSDELPVYLHAVIMEALSASNRFASVSDQLVNSQHNHKLLIKVSAFQAELSEAPPETAAVRVTLEAFLLNSKSQQLLLHKRYQASKEGIEKRVSVLVKALNQALGEVLGQLMHDLTSRQ